MPREGIVNNFYFDAEIFTDYMQEQSTLNDAILASGILQYDPIIAKSIGASGNVFSVPAFSNIDGEADALNDDGKTNNVPTELQGKKMLVMSIARMKAWMEKTFTRYLTGQSPLHNLANNLVVPYWRLQRQKDLLAVLSGVLGAAGMESHVTDLSTTSGTIADANKIALTSTIDLGQKAVGDRRSGFSLFICHSAVAANLRKQELLQNVTNFNEILGRDVTLPMCNGMIVLETDTGTVDTSVENFPVYTSYMVGRGQIGTADKVVHNAYDVDYDPETNGGEEKLYTKQAYVYAPYGFSIKADEIKEESPTREELKNPANWELKVDNKLILIAAIKSNG